MRHKYLIVNADDFGLTSGVNQGIVKSFCEGIVKSASIMPVGRAYDEAVQLAEKNRDLGIGIHLCLSEERPILKKSEIPSLVVNEGKFFKSHKEFILNYLLGNIDIYDIEKEIDAQIVKVLGSGLIATHIDSHGYLHILPSILKTIIKLAKKYKIPFVTYPYERLITVKAKPSRHILRFAFRILYLYSQNRIIGKKVLMPKYFYGFLLSGHLSEVYLRRIFTLLDSGIAEIICHPGIKEQEMQNYSHWKYAWEEELKILTSLEIKKMIKEFNIELVNFRNLL